LLYIFIRLKTGYRLYKLVTASWSTSLTVAATSLF